MLPNEIIKQENAIEEYFCKSFEKAKRFPMNEETTKYLIQLIMCKDKFEIPEKEKPFLVKLIDGRIKASFNYEINDMRLQLFLAIISQKPGTAVMYLTYLQYWCKKRNCKEIDLEKFCEIFPIGFPSETDLQKIWDEQKVERDNWRNPDNLLDYQTAMV